MERDSLSSTFQVSLNIFKRSEMKSSAEIRTPRILSVSILHRHGARGPGASEVAPFSNLVDVCSQWNESDYEELTPVGHTMITTLGTWFAKKYTSKLCTPKVMFRCSKSGRAMESGLDFVQAFNEVIDRENSTIPEKPTPFGFTAEKVKIDEDYFFRPWKVQKELTDQAKVSAKEDPKFVEIATKNKEFLRELFILAGAKDEYQKNPYKAFWSSTHIFALLECESFWPKPNNKMALSRRIPINLRSKIEELACQVWDRRFLHSGCDVVMGAPLCLELFQQAFNTDYNVNIYSAHDYSILSVLGSLGIIPALKEATQFGCFLIFELWDGTPPDHPGGGQKLVRSMPCSPMRDRFINKRSKSANNFLNEKNDYENRVLRILANFRPFQTSETDPLIELGKEIDESKEMVLAEFSMEEVRAKHNTLFECLISKGMYSPPYAKNSKI